METCQGDGRGHGQWRGASERLLWPGEQLQGQELRLVASLFSVSPWGAAGSSSRPVWLLVSGGVGQEPIPVRHPLVGGSWTVRWARLSERRTAACGSALSASKGSEPCCLPLPLHPLQTPPWSFLTGRLPVRVSHVQPHPGTLMLPMKSPTRSLGTKSGREAGNDLAECSTFQPR